jgi:hypothetical protein
MLKTGVIGVLAAGEDIDPPPTRLPGVLAVGAAGETAVDTDATGGM